MRKELIRMAVFACMLYAPSLRAQFSLRPVDPVDWRYGAWHCPPGIHAKRFPVSAFSPFYGTRQPSRIAFSSVKLYAQAQHITTFTSHGIPFDHRAVFCRMENHCQRNYNFKFSIRAGGYRE